MVRLLYRKNAERATKHPTLSAQFRAVQFVGRIVQAGCEPSAGVELRTTFHEFHG